MSANFLIYRPEYVSGELLTSYLARTAHRYGLSATEFTANYLPQYAVWNRDVDRSAPDSLISSLAELLNVTKAQNESMTLRSLEAAIEGEAYFNKNSVRRVALGINAVGVYHRTRTRYGLQFCPDCLSETAVYRRIWRIAFATVCHTHRRLLHDCCPNCQAPIVLHRSATKSTHCYACSHDLRTAPRQDRQVQIDVALKVQSRYFDTLRNRGPADPTGAMDGGDLLRGVYALQCAIKDALRLHRNVEVYDTVRELARQHSRDELSRIDARLQSVLLQDAVLRDWPHSFLNIAQSLRITQLLFARKAPLPVWVANVVALLPPGCSRTLSKRRSSFRSALRKLHRTKPNHWRTLRAELLLEAAERIK